MMFSYFICVMANKWFVIKRSGGYLTIKTGYFSDAGEEIDPLSVPMPVLCTSCLKKNDAREEAPCLLNRMDQMEEMKNGHRL